MPCRKAEALSSLQDTLKTWPRPASRPVPGLTFSLCANRLFPTARLSCKQLTDPSLKW